MEKYAKEVELTGSRCWYGVGVPAWLRAFDCRGEPLAGPYMGSEKAEVALGLRVGDERHGTTPLSCQTYIDARTAGVEELRRQVTDMVREAERFKAEYDQAPTVDQGHGGSCLHLPVALCMSNFGWSILCDRRTMRVCYFGGA